VREITLREISNESKISFRYLEALEQDRFEILPAAVFARGFLREYARFVGLDPDEVVNYYLSALPPVVPEEDVEPQKVIPAERSSAWWPIVGGLGVLTVALMAFYWSSLQSPKESSIPEIVPQAVGSAVDAVEVVEPEARQPIRMTLDFRQNSWVKVVVDGERQVSELRVQGESLKRSAQRELRITLGNVAGVTLEINETPIPLEVRDDEELVIDLEALARLGVGGGEPSAPDA